MSSNRKMSLSFFFAFIVFLVLVDLSMSLEIEVYNGSQLLETYRDRNAIFDGRSVGLYYERGTIVYPVPRNACSSVDVDNNYDIAFVPNYDDCPSDNIANIAQARYGTILSYSPSSLTLPQNGNFAITAVLIKDLWFALYLESLLNTSDSNTIQVEIYEDYWPFYEKIILIFCLILMCAISLATCIFLCSLCTRWSCQKWRERGLTRWRIRQLPQRRYNSREETSQTCSICLDDFKDGEKLRVLPCGHIFHPKCVDEWLQKWKRNCPLCKSQISRRNQRQSETARLLPHTNNDEEEETTPTSYGATADTTPQTNDDDLISLNVLLEQRQSEEENQERT